MSLSSNSLKQPLRRADGVIITHDPFSPGMMEKYGKPGHTDNEGFDPYADTVGPGIYGGLVKRSPETGKIIIGKQYQNHNPRPGPVYAGGGYTNMCRALQSGKQGNVAKLLRKYPDLVNEMSTGGAQPLHNCGMSRNSQLLTGYIVSMGGDIEALDTYGMTPLHRMASNNLAIGARALLDAGANPENTGGIHRTPLQIAKSSGATAVTEVLSNFGTQRLSVNIEKILVLGIEETDFSSVGGLFVSKSASEIPKGFAQVCDDHGWDTDNTWAHLNGGHSWFSNANNNGAYIYWNQSDKCWWIDAPSGDGIFKAKGPAHAPPAHGWKPLKGPTSSSDPVILTFKSVNQQN